MQKKLLIWDLDDTLVDNVHDYAEPILDACRLIIRTLGSAAPHVSAIIALEQELDGKRVKEINLATGKPFGYTMERFPGSMVELYRQICEKAHAGIRKDVEVELKRIGMMAFDKGRYKSNIKPGAIGLLKNLQDAGHGNVLLTKGDPRVQQMKIDALIETAREKIFDDVRIVETNKDPAVFLEIGEAHGASDRIVYAVGNDYKKDVLPALQAHASFRGIWIPVETWETIGQTEKLMAEVDRERCHVFKNLRELDEEILA